MKYSSTTRVANPYPKKFSKGLITMRLQDLLPKSSKRRWRGIVLYFGKLYLLCNLCRKIIVIDITAVCPCRKLRPLRLLRKSITIYLPTGLRAGFLRRKSQLLRRLRFPSMCRFLTAVFSGSRRNRRNFVLGCAAHPAAAYKV